MPMWKDCFSGLIGEFLFFPPPPSPFFCCFALNFVFDVSATRGWLQHVEVPVNTSSSSSSSSQP